MGNAALGAFNLYSLLFDAFPKQCQHSRLAMKIVRPVVGSGMNAAKLFEAHLSFWFTRKSVTNRGSSTGLVVLRMLDVKEVDMTNHKLKKRPL